MYQQINISDHSFVGSPGPLPSNLSGWADAAVADVSAAVSPAPLGMAGQGWWPVTLTTPSYDPTAQTLDGTYTYAVSVPSRTVTGTANLRAATSAETSAAQATLRQAQGAILSAACTAQIVGGYQSSALGVVHTYPSKPTDQTNMLGSVLASLLPGLPSGWTTPFWCADANGTWSFASHTAAQIQQAGADGKASVAGAQGKLLSLETKLAQAQSQADIAAVVW